MASKLRTFVKVNINGNKLKDIIADKGLTGRQVAIMMGRSEDYVNTMIRKNEANQTDIIALCSVIGIPVDSVVVQEKIQKKEESQEEKDSELKITNQYLKIIADCLTEMTVLYKRAWIDKEE